jgi:dTDP-4-dehydrorhamnose reductase
MAEQSEKVKILVLGSNGQLGQTFQSLYIKNHWSWARFVFLTKSQLDISKPKDVKASIEAIKPDVIINCAAYTAVDKAESDVATCFEINTKSCQHITDAIVDTKIKLVHFSSDYVYHPTDEIPILEESATNPKGIYATSKLEGDKIILSSKVNALIIRTSWVISAFGHNFVKTMMRLGNEKNSLKVVNDQFGAPTYTHDLAMAVMDIIKTTLDIPDQEKDFNAIYNFSNEGFATWAAIAKLVMETANLDCEIIPITTSEYPTPATRPSWSVMSLDKIKNTYGLNIPMWQDAVVRCVNENLMANHKFI